MTPPNDNAVTVIPITEKASIVKYLTSTIPLNDYGLPEYIYRSDFLPLTLDDLDPQEKGDALEAALTELDYSQGYPTLNNGEPFWGRLDCEPSQAYNTFLLYLELPRPSQESKVYAPVRQLHILSETAATPTEELLSLSHLFYWPQRARAYDLFIAASHNKQKEQRLMNIEDSHYNKAEHYIQYATQFLDKVFQDPDGGGLKPKDAIDLLKLMLSVQRISVGASTGANAGKQSHTTPAHASLEVTLKTIAAAAGETSRQANAGDLTKQLLEDPEMLAQAQELIIKMGEMENGRVQKAVEAAEAKAEELEVNDE